MAAPKSNSRSLGAGGFALRQLNEQLEQVYALVSLMRSRATSESDEVRIDLPLVHVLDIAMQVAGDREALHALEDELLGISADQPVPRIDKSPRARN